MFSALRRIYTGSNPPRPTKATNPVRFGILGAARIGPDALINPAKSHTDVLIVAVASRDHQKAQSYAKTHGIRKTYSGDGCYQELLDDPEIDAVYNPLPNGLHFEWTMRALERGKHVLVEKPIANSAAEAEQLIRMAQSKGVVLLEGIHYTFHPAVQRLKEIVSNGNLGAVKSIKAEFGVPSILSGLFFLKDDVRYDFDLGGGVTMDMGVYALSMTRYLSGEEPQSIQRAQSVGHYLDPTRIDRSMHAFYTFPRDVSAEIYVDFAMPGRGLFGLIPRSFKTTVSIELEGGSVTMDNFPLPHLWHSIVITPSGGKKTVEKVYKFEHLGEEWWTSYRYQLEAFVTKVRGGKPHTWPMEDESIRQMILVESIYAKSGLPPRPESTYMSRG